MERWYAIRKKGKVMDGWMEGRQDEWMDGWMDG